MAEIDQQETQDLLETASDDLSGLATAIAERDYSGSVATLMGIRNTLAEISTFLQTKDPEAGADTEEDESDD